MLITDSDQMAQSAAHILSDDFKSSTLCLQIITLIYKHFLNVQSR